MLTNGIYAITKRVGWMGERRKIGDLVEVRVESNTRVVYNYLADTDGLKYFRETESFMLCNPVLATPLLKELF